MPEKKSAKKFLRKERLFGTVIAIGWPFAGISMIFAVLANLELHDWICDLITNFWIQYLAVMILFSLILLLAKRTVQLMALAPFILLCLVKIMPVYFPIPRPLIDSVKVGLLSMNVNTKNKHYGRALQCVAEIQPDIVLFEEVDDKWLAELKGRISNEYKLVEAKPRSDNFGIALFSKIPYVESRIMELGYVKVPAVEVKLKKADKQFTVFGVHVLPPTSGSKFRDRNLALDEIALIRQKNSSKRFVLIGDLNSTIWSPFFKDLLKNAQLKDTSPGFGVKPTWPVSLMGIAGIAIDHCLASEHFEACERRRGSDIGSDHLPLYVELSIVK